MNGFKPGELPGRGHSARWSFTENGAGESYSSIGAADRSIHIFGNFGDGTLTMEGSNDPLEASWAPLIATTGAEIVVTTNTLAMIAQNSEFIRANLTGSTNPDLHANMVSRKG